MVFVENAYDDIFRFIGEGLLWPKFNVKFHRMILFIKR